MIKLAITILDVQKKTGYSLSTISKYLNGGNLREKNRIAIEKAISELGFKPNQIARGLRNSKTRTVGVLIPSLSNLFSTTIITAMEKVLQKNEYGVIICDCGENAEIEAQKTQFLIDKKVDGIITMPFSLDSTHLALAQKSGVPVVIIDRMLSPFECDVVLVDNLNASYCAVEQLIIGGHKRIGIICGPQNIFTTEERLKGYLRALDDYYISLDNTLIKFGDYNIESGYEKLTELWSLENKPTAIFVTNYEMTIGAIMAINSLSIDVPNELSIIGFDNIQLSAVVKPPLSVVSQPMEKIGEVVAKLILKRMNGDNSDFPQILRLKTEMEIKASVKKI